MTEKVVFSVKITNTETNEVLNDVILYQNDKLELRIENSNGVEQIVCPNLRYCGSGFYCGKAYDNKYSKIDVSNWVSESNGYYVSMFDPNFKRAQNTCTAYCFDEFKKCKEYNAFYIEDVLELKGTIPCRRIADGAEGVYNPETKEFKYPVVLKRINSIMSEMEE